MLRDKHIVLGVTGGIAAYKAAELASRLVKAGAKVHVIMTQEAARFITPLTMREISKNPVAVSMWEEPARWNVEHIALASLADLFLIAPATANIVGKIAHGIADDMLSTTVMATAAPVFLAPAMNSNMYENKVVQDNLNRLRALGYRILPPASGMLACGVVGIGRLPEPETIVDWVVGCVKEGARLAGKKVLVTAGGTIEPIDPVRFIGNRSSGKMGYAIAAEAARRGADVALVSGPSALGAPASVRKIAIETAKEMLNAVLEEFADSDVIIKAAAVADYRAQRAQPHKIKKQEDVLTLVLEKNPDILMELGKRKRADQILVGFAAETQNLIQYAQEKLIKKNLDMIVANDVTAKNAGFNADTNIAKLIDRSGDIEDLPLMSKEDLAKVILDKIEAKF